METYIITFGTGNEAITAYNYNCCNFSECAVRLDFTGFDVTTITNITRIIQTTITTNPHA